MYPEIGYMEKFLAQRCEEFAQAQSQLRACDLSDADALAQVAQRLQACCEHTLRTAREATAFCRTLNEDIETLKEEE